MIIKIDSAKLKLLITFSESKIRSMVELIPLIGYVMIPWGNTNYKSKFAIK